MFLGSPFMPDFINTDADTTLNQGTIVIELDRIENAKGSIQISLFANSDGFPDDWEKAFTSKSVAVTDNLKEIRLEDIPFGTYGIALIHDENENFELDTNFFGVPKEGYGFSNNARGRFGPPDYSDTEFTLETERLVLQIEMKY
jgi:uncharacterized protein (DUF2141 family)